MKDPHPSILREKKTLEAMIKIYCRHKHEAADELCSECEELLKYAKLRLDKCRYQEDKTTCAKCQTHCYKTQMRESIRTVMRYSGPRMLLRHPVLTVHHAIKGAKKQKKSSKKNE
jgi:hypothetical protein